MTNEVSSSAKPKKPAAAGKDKGGSSNGSTAGVQKKPSSSSSRPNHPSTAEMVVAAISTLKDRKGCSLQAIKKYIAGTYVCDIDRLAFHIRKFLRTAVEDGKIVQTKGTGASGRFKLATSEKRPRSSKKSTEKDAVDKKPMKKTIKKTTGKSTATVSKSPKPKKAAAKKSKQ